MSIRMVIVLLINLYSSRVLLDALGVEDYGVYNVVAGFASMFAFLNTSLSNGIQRFYNHELGRNGILGAGKVFNAAILIQLVLAIIIVIPSEILGIWYIHNKMIIPDTRLFAAEIIFHLSILTLLINIFQVPFMASVMAHERMDFLAIMSVSNSFMTLIAVLCLPLMEGDLLILYGIVILLLSLVSLIIYYLYARINFKEIRFHLSKDNSLLKGMITFSGWNIFGTFGALLKDQGVNLILNSFYGPIVNAARGVANQVNGGLQSVVNNIIIPVRPQVVQSYAKGDYSRTYSLTYTISKFSTYFLFLVALPVVLEIDFVLYVWLGENIPKHTSSFVGIVIMDTFFLNLNSSVSGIVHASGKMKKYQLSGGSISILCVVGAYLGITLFNVPEMALAMVAVFDCIRQIVALIVLKDIEKDRFSYKDYMSKVLSPIFQVVLVSAILPICMHYFIDPGLIRFIVTILSSIISVFVVVYLIGLTDSEKLLIKEIVIKFIKR